MTHVAELAGVGPQDEHEVSSDADGTDHDHCNLEVHQHRGLHLVLLDDVDQGEESILDIIAANLQTERGRNSSEHMLLAMLVLGRGNADQKLTSAMNLARAELKPMVL